MQQRHDDDPARPRRRYHSPRRRDQARATRAVIATAARELFLERGWSGTTVRDVAARAGVGEATVYTAYGSKAGLARALVDAVELAADVPDDVQRALASCPDDPRGQLAALAASDRKLFERNGNLIATLADAGHVEPALRAAYDAGRAAAAEFHRGVFESWPAHWFREGVDAAYAADSYAALCTIGVYRVLTDERGWTAEAVQNWWLDSLARLILPS